MPLPQWWSDSSDTQKFALGTGGVLFVLSLLVAVVWIAARASYEPLFNGLKPEQLTEVANQLSQYGINYKLDEGSGRILVAKSDIRKARTTVAERGLPIGKPNGFELFNDVKFGMTDFTQRINYQRALEGELTRTILALEEVQTARLHLVLPESGLFSKDASSAKASLTISLKPGRFLTERQIAGLQSLIAASVPGLQPGQVAIHDELGKSLNGHPNDSTSSAWIAARFEAKRLYEHHIVEKATTILEKALGAGRAFVIADVELDHNKRHVVREESLPVGQGITGTVRKLKSLRGPTQLRDTSGGSPGDGIDQLLMSPNTTTEVEYEAGRQQENIDVVQGAIKRLTISIVVPAGTSDEQKTVLGALVSNAIGFNTAREDAMTVIEAPEAFLGAAISAPSAGSALESVENALGATHPLLRLSVNGWTLAAACGIFLLLIAAVLLARRSGSGRRKLTTSEREKVLAEMKAWLAADPDGKVRA